MLHKIFILCMVSLAAQALGGSDDKFIKKYAMMKIYESCFGPEVVKQIRMEMKQAYLKCFVEEQVKPIVQVQNPSIPPILLGKLPPGFAMDPATQTITKPADGAVPQNDLPQKPMPNVLPFRQGPFQPQSPYMIPGQYRPFPQPYYQVPYNPMFYPPGVQGVQGMQGVQGVQYNPYAFQQQQYQPGFYQNPYFANNNRMARDLQDLHDVRGPSAGRIKNITCVMQELGYIDHNMEPNYEQITERINNLPVSAELKNDIQEGLEFCHKFSECVPDVKRDVSPLSQELIKPMFFFRCYKHKKLEACIMKDIRERFTTEDELDDADSDFRSISRSARSVREDSDPRLEALDEMRVYLYDYLSGGNVLDYDLYL